MTRRLAVIAPIVAAAAACSSTLSVDAPVDAGTSTSDAGLDADGAGIPGTTILLPRASLAGLRPWVSGGGDPGTTYAIDAGELVISGPLFGYIATERDDFGDMTMSFEWKWEEIGNSGIFIHVSGPDQIWPRTLEVQLFSGNAGDFLALTGTEMRADEDGGLVANKPRAAGTEKPLGEWNSGIIEIAAGRLRFMLNGVVANEAYLDPTARGRVAFESEGGRIRFRNASIREP